MAINGVVVLLQGEGKGTWQEALYWMELLTAKGYLSNTEAASMHQDSTAFLKMRTATIKSLKAENTQYAES